MSKRLQIKWAKAGKMNFVNNFWGNINSPFLPFSQPYVKEGFIFLKESTPLVFKYVIYYYWNFGYDIWANKGLQMINKRKK